MTLDTKTLSLDFENTEDEKLKEITRHMSEFVTYFEIADARMSEWKRHIEHSIEASQDHLNQQLLEIRETVDQLSAVLSDNSITHLRIAADASVRQGKEHLKAIEAASGAVLRQQQAKMEEFSQLSKNTFDRLDRAAAYIIKNISEAVSSFRIGDFQRLTEQSRELVEETSKSALARFKEMARWFHWKNLATAFVITLFASLSVSLYLSDEMPWEQHKDVLSQRQAGQALMAAWPSLSEAEKEIIIKHSKKSTFKTIT